MSGVTGKRSTAEAAELRDYFLTYVAPDVAAHGVQRAEGAASTKDRTSSGRIPTAMVMSEMTKPRETFVLARGDYRNQTEKVQPGVPAMLPPLPKDAPPNRLTLAKWLVDPAHPLTARVAVNRFWQMYFGTGIVKTQEDFGVQGEPPVHPELLDWLATEFIRTGWDVRAMQRLIVTSATYRQSSKRDAGAAREGSGEPAAGARAAHAPPGGDDSRHGARGAACSTARSADRACSRISRRACGRRWRSAKASRRRSYEQSHGKDLYRRGLYTFWKRTVPPASLATFDAPDREKCTARRALTNTPLQALVLLNDPTYVEAARALAQRALLEGGNEREGADRVRLPPRHRAAGRPPRRRRCCSDLLDEAAGLVPPRSAGGAPVARASASHPRDAQAGRRRARGVDDGRQHDPEPG